MRIHLEKRAKSIPNATKGFYRDAVIFNIGLVALLTLTINGVTMGPLVRLLGLSKQSSEIAEKNLQRVIDELDSRLRKKIHHLNKDGSKARVESRIHELTRKKGTHKSHDKNKDTNAIGHVRLSAAARAMMMTKTITLERVQSEADPLKMPKDESHKNNHHHHHHHHQHTEHIHVNHHEFEHVDWNTVYQYMNSE